MFTHAITRRPCEAMIDGISTAGLGPPDYELACSQHADYVAALESCGLIITVLPADQEYPDSTFVENVAVMLPNAVVLTRPGAVSRRGEVLQIRPTLETLVGNISMIQPPGTLEGGDVMMVGTHFYIGLSDRTNEAGARQMIAILEKCGLTGSTVALEEMLHLKSGVSYIESGNLLAYGELIGKPEFKQFDTLQISESEAYAANSLWLNGTVLVPQGHPDTAIAIESRGYSVRMLNVSEFQKLDGGLSCLSLRF